jgi:hypothetical protein
MTITVVGLVISAGPQAAKWQFRQRSEPIAQSATCCWPHQSLSGSIFRYQRVHREVRRNSPRTTPEALSLGHGTDLTGVLLDPYSEER